MSRPLLVIASGRGGAKRARARTRRHGHGPAFALREPPVLVEPCAHADDGLPVLLSPDAGVCDAAAEGCLLDVDVDTRDMDKPLLIIREQDPERRDLHPSKRRRKCVGTTVLNQMPHALPALRADGGGRGLTGAFRWAHNTLHALLPVLGLPALQNSLLCRPGGIDLSSHFSGTGAAEVATNMITAACTSVLGHPSPVSLRCRAVCDNNRACQRVLRERMPQDTCIFADLLDAVPGSPDVQKEWGSVDAAWKRLRTMAIAPNRFCAQHGSNCPFPPVVGDVSGSPCQPWSRCGRLQRHRDPRVFLLVCWARWVHEAALLWAIHENVVGFDTDVLQQLLGDSYDMVTLRSCPADAGFCLIRRPRLYTILWRRSAIEPLADLSAVYTAVAQRITGSLEAPPQLQDCLLASQSLLYAEETRARAKNGLPPRLAGEVSLDWTYLLTEGQLRRLSGYMATSAQDAVVDLTQNPDKRPCTSGRKRRLPALRHSGSLLWAPALQRWLLPRELAAASGFPVEPCLAKAAGVVLDACCDDYTTSLLGNAMHVGSVGMSLFIALACLQETVCP